jgi:hypothetical protein
MFEGSAGSFIEYKMDAPITYTLGTFVTNQHLCPDLLRYEQIGAADGWRGRVVRLFFWLMRLWPVHT